jgi:septum formation protein
MLRGMGVQFEIVASNVEELADGPFAPAEVAITNACRKALSVADAHRDALVLGADTVVALGDRLFGKPADTGAAASMLGELSGKTHDVTTGMCLVRRSAGEFLVFAETTRVRFRRLTARQIEDYLGRVHVLDKAGAYAIQEHGAALIRSVSGSRCNVAGLPVERLGAVLSRTR